MSPRDDLRRSLERDEQRRQQARLHNGFFGLLMYGGTVGLLLAMPMVVGAYLGSWLDSLNEEFDTRWTVSLIIIGVVAGVWNVIWYIRGRL